MTVSAPGDTVDGAWRTRIPPGWQTFPDGSIGPPNGAPGSDWNAPYRTASGVGPPSPSQLRGVSGGPGMGNPALNGGAVPGTTINQTGGAPNAGNVGPSIDSGKSGPVINLGDQSEAPPELFPGRPQNTRSILPESLTNGPRIDPGEFEQPTGGSVGSGITQAILSRFGLPGAAAAATQPLWWPWMKNFKNTDTGLAPGIDEYGAPATSLGSDAGPGPKGAPPGRDVNPTPWFTPSNNPMPWRGGSGAPAGGGGGKVAPGSVNLGRGVPGVHPAVIAHAAAAAAQQPNNSPFIGIDRPNADVTGHARGYNSGVQGTALDLSHLFGGAPPPAAPAPAPRPVARAPARRAPVKGPLAKGALPPGPMDPEIIARSAPGGFHPRNVPPTAWNDPAGSGNFGWPVGGDNGM